MVVLPISETTKPTIPIGQGYRWQQWGSPTRLVPRSRFKVFVFRIILAGWVLFASMTVWITGNLFSGCGAC